jgi:squalene-hopene/tetraprenyl-beta-curcumene cyclase
LLENTDANRTGTRRVLSVQKEHKEQRKMLKTTTKPINTSVSEDFFPLHVWQGVLKTRKRADLLNSNWSALNLSENTTISIYDCYPYLFMEAFPHLREADIDNFSLATKLFASSIFYADKIMDGDDTAQSATTTTLLAHVLAMQSEGNALLRQLFPHTSPFWKQFQAYLAHFLRVCMQEKQFVAGKIDWSEYDEQTAMDIAVGKCGISQAVIAGLVDLAQDERPFEALQESINLYNFACQLFDDLYDWKNDYLQSTPSLLLCLALQRKRPLQPSQDGLDALAREIYYGGYASVTLQQAIDALERARDIIAPFPAISWHIVLTRLFERCENLNHDILKITERNLRRAQQTVQFQLHLPLMQTPCDQLAIQALQFIIQQWQRGFGEMRHVMYFPHFQGFTGTSEVHYGDTFQRAIIADTLWEVAQTFQLDLQPVLENEIHYLLGVRCTNGVGGWSYFPELPELAPDADDLAQILQLFLHTGHCTEIADYCEQPLTTLLTENRHADGSFETWIIPTEYQTPIQQRQHLYAQTVWGTGADNDVMANMLYALHLYDHARFAAVIEAGVLYIEQQQQSDGSWLSTWYHGPFYGTFVCVRLLALTKPDSPALKKAREFLSRRQEDDGGWSLVNEQSDSLSTALALLCYAELTRQGFTTDSWQRGSISRALDFLQASYQNENGCWPACEFIRMEIGRATGKTIQILSYGSKTITTTFVLKAAAAWHCLEQL